MSKSLHNTKTYTTIHISMSPRFKERLLYETTIAGVSVSTYIKHALLEKWGDLHSIPKQLSPSIAKDLAGLRKDYEAGKIMTSDEFLKS